MNTTELNKVSPLKYDIYNKILAMAEFYFGEDSDYLKTGFMGWLIECMTMFIRDSSLQKTMLKNELKLSLRGMDMFIFAICMPVVVTIILGAIYGNKPAFDGADFTFMDMGKIC